VTVPVAGSPHLDGYHDPRAVPQPADQIADAFPPAVLGVQECLSYWRTGVFQDSRHRLNPVPCGCAAGRARHDSHTWVLAEVCNLPASGRTADTASQTAKSRR
jgi:hypothetical protein